MMVLLAKFHLIWFTLKCNKAPDDIWVGKSLENSWTWGLIYIRKAKLFHRPIIMMVKFLTPARWSYIAKLVLIEWVPTLFGWNPNLLSSKVRHVALKCTSISVACMGIGPESDW